MNLLSGTFGIFVFCGILAALLAPIVFAAAWVAKAPNRWVMTGSVVATLWMLPFLGALGYLANRDADLNEKMTRQLDRVEDRRFKSDLGDLARGLRRGAHKTNIADVENFLTSRAATFVGVLYGVAIGAALVTAIAHGLAVAFDRRLDRKQSIRVFAVASALYLAVFAAVRL